MIELNIQKFLRENETPLDKLKEEFAIEYRTHSEYPNLHQFSYSQIDSPKSHPIVREARGIILDKSDNWNVVSYPYLRFFNYGEGGADPIDWSTATVYEKLDGSLIQLYYYDNKWIAASRSLPDAAGEVGGFDFNFAQLFWKVWKELNYSLPAHTGRCYMFELMTPYNKVVVNHKQNSLVLHGVRDLCTLQEIDPEEVASYYGWRSPKKYQLNSWDGIVSTFADLSPMWFEGYIVRDASFSRVKLKSPAYVALSHLRDGMSKRRLLEIIRTNEGDEFLTYFEEFREEYDKLKQKYNNLVAIIKQAYEQAKHLEVQKDFALAIAHVPAPGNGVLFSLRAGKINSVEEGLSQVTIQSLERVLGA